MPHAIPPGPYCPSPESGSREPYGPLSILPESEAVRAEYLSGCDMTWAIFLAKGCAENGIPFGVLLPRLVWQLAFNAACANLNSADQSQCWELARLVLAEASERMRAADDWEEYTPSDPPQTEKL